ncbi:MAG: phage tail protein [Candidatus Methanoperedens sp.]
MDNRSKYLRYLPGIYQGEEGDVFLGNFLKSFENILSAYPLFPDDIKDIDGLVSKLKDSKNLLSQFIQGNFSTETINLLNAYDGSQSDALKKALVSELNKLSRGISIYEEKRFEQITLTDATKRLIRQNPTGEDLIRLNMMLLEQAFSNEIKKLKGIEEILDEIQNYFDPYNTPREFLQWLAGWMALILKEEQDWNANDNIKKRDLIARIIPLYQKRGTLQGLKEYIKIYVGEDVKVSIYELLEPFRVGVTSTVGMNTVIGEGLPYYFQVYMELAVPDRVLLEKKRQAINDIINQEKPAHTYYTLIIQVPTIQIAVRSTVGLDTMLGGIINE